MNSLTGTALVVWLTLAGFLPVASGREAAAPLLAASSSICDDLMTRVHLRPADLALALIGRSRPVHREPRFELNLDTNSLISPAFSATRLRQHAVRAIGDGLDGLAQLGFRPKSSLTILLGNGSPSVLGRDRTETEWTPTEEVFAHVIDDADVELAVKGHFARPRGLGLARIYLIFSKDTQGPNHLVQYPFVVAHELAHTTEPDGLSPIWQEARADFLAYLVTGTPDFTLGYERSLKSASPSGEELVVHRKIIRSLINPRLRTIDQIVPLAAAHHSNSELLSSALFDLVALVGRDRVLGYVRDIDENPCPLRAYSKIRRNFLYDHQVIADHLKCHAARLIESLRRDQVLTPPALNVFRTRGLGD